MASNQMIALLGLLALAGYQNRDKLGELFGRVTGAPSGPPAGAGQSPGTQNSGLGGLLGNLGGLFGGASTGAAVSGGLGELLEQFTRRGEGETAKSWVETGPNNRPEGAARSLGERQRGSIHAENAGHQRCREEKRREDRKPHDRLTWRHGTRVIQEQPWSDRFTTNAAG